MEKSYRPRFGYDIRINRGEAPRDVREHPCAVPGCRAEGVCYSPVSPRDLQHRLWLCADHAREHNARWDFFEGMSESEILRFQEESVFGHRPTWPLGKRAADDRGFVHTVRHGSYVFDDGFVIFDDDERPQPPRKPKRVLTAHQTQAFDTLGLEVSASLNEIKARYKELVKRFHPDANGGDRGAEDRLRQVIHAYGVLRATGLV